jgi:hypothetical protein
MSKMIDVDIAQKIADLISSLEANHIVVAQIMAEDAPDFERVRLWKSWRQDDYKALQALGVPVYNPAEDNREEN